MGLKFVSSIFFNGSLTTKHDKEVERSSESCMNALVYVMGQNHTLTAISHYVNFRCHLKEEPKVYTHDEGYCITRLSSREQRDNVLYSRPHLFYYKPMIVKH